MNLLNRLTNEKMDQWLVDNKATISRIDDIINTDTCIRWKCLEQECFHIWLARPTSIKDKRSGCPKCAGVFPIDNNSIDCFLAANNRSIKRIGTVSGVANKIEWKCLIDICNHIRS